MGLASAHWRLKGLRVRLRAVIAASPTLARRRQAAVLLSIPCRWAGAICLQTRSSWPEKLGPAPEGAPWRLNLMWLGQPSQDTLLLLLVKRQWYVLGENSFSGGSGRPSLSCLRGWALHSIMRCQPECFSLEPQVFSMPLYLFSLTILCEIKERFRDFWSGAFYYTCNSSLP